MRSRMRSPRWRADHGIVNALEPATATTTSLLCDVVIALERMGRWPARQFEFAAIVSCFRGAACFEASAEDSSNDPTLNPFLATRIVLFAISA